MYNVNKNLENNAAFYNAGGINTSQCNMFMNSILFLLNLLTLKLSKYIDTTCLLSYIIY